MKNAGPRFLTHTYTQGCLLYSMYVWAQGPTQACWSIRMTVFPPLLCSHEDCVFAAVYGGVDLRDEASCMYMSACWASCDTQVLDILTLNSSCWSLWCRMFSSGATCVPLVYWNELFVYISSICIYVCEPCALLSVEALLQTVCIYCSIITLVKTLLSVMFSIFPVSPVKVWLHAIVGHFKVMPLMLTSDTRIMTKVPLPAYSWSDLSAVTSSSIMLKLQSQWIRATSLSTRTFCPRKSFVWNKVKWE